LRKDFEGQTDGQVVAKAALSAVCTGAFTARKFSNYMTSDIGANEGVEVMEAEVAKVKAGDMSSVEAMLVSQTIALNSIFADMAGRAAGSLSAGPGRVEVYMRMAMKAQAQCRATIETLAEVKNPKSTTFVKQQNNAAQQQVNNGADAHTQARTEKNINPPNELLGPQNE